MREVVDTLVLATTLHIYRWAAGPPRRDPYLCATLDHEVRLRDDESAGTGGLYGVHWQAIERLVWIVALAYSLATVVWFPRQFARFRDEAWAVVRS
jgi:hypothetical protein